MTEFWVSKKRYWCKYCKCWMADTKVRHRGGVGLRAGWLASAALPTKPQRV